MQSLVKAFSSVDEALNYMRSKDEVDTIGRIQLDIKDRISLEKRFRSHITMLATCISGGVFTIWDAITFNKKLPENVIMSIAISSIMLTRSVLSKLTNADTVVLHDSRTNMTLLQGLEYIQDILEASLAKNHNLDNNDSSFKDTISQ